MCQCLPCLAAHITDHSADADKDVCCAKCWFKLMSTSILTGAQNWGHSCMAKPFAAELLALKLPQFWGFYFSILAELWFALVST